MWQHLSKKIPFGQAISTKTWISATTSALVTWNVFHESIQADDMPEKKHVMFPSDEVVDRTKTSSKDLAQMDKDCTRCEKMKDDALKTCRSINFMCDDLTRAGCPVNPYDFISCRPCEGDMAGAMVTDDNGHIKEIVVCQNSFRNQTHFERVVTHELIHVYDMCRAEVDTSNPRHVACTEIRAANLSMDCLFTAELRRGNFNVTNGHNKCVRRRAILSLKANEAFADKAEQAVDDVFDRCSRDHAPFGSIPF